MGNFLIPFPNNALAKVNFQIVKTALKSTAPLSAPAILQVALPTPLNRLFDYLPPEGFDPARLHVGARLSVPFGRSKMVGLLVAMATESEVDPARLKRVHAVLDDEMLIPPGLLKLLRWGADYYHHPLGEVVASALPVLLRQGEAAVAQPRRCWRLSDEGRGVDLDKLTRRAPRQVALMQRLLAAADGLFDSQLSEAMPGWQSVMRGLEKKAWVVMTEVAALVQPEPAAEALPSLNEDQQAAVAAITAASGFQAYLLDGVTGSGKTEVYLRAVQHAVEQGRQVLVLVPEITLTPQLVERFRRRLGVPLAVLHSAMNDRERLNAWLYARSGEAQVVIGTRSAVFTPMPKLGLMIIDEEHDASLKQQTGFRYSARDLALVRARNQAIPIVLGSATPGFESLLNAQQGRYHHLSLPQRAGDARPPQVRLLDVCGQKMDEMLSEPLLKQMQRHLDAGGQVLLFLNRRGFSPTLICHECGWVAECRRCDVHMTLHQRSRSLRCHHCDSQRPLPRQCPDCGSVDLRPLGSGTERVDDALARHFPDMVVARLDRDSTRRKGSLETILDDVSRGDCRILVGTQMLAKGHHFPNVTLVGILDGDQGLFGIDFRAGERMAQLITQVAGRAGRGDKTGEVVIQTHHADHPLLQLLCEQGYHAYAEAGLAERCTAALPPYHFMALLRAEAAQPSLPDEFLEQALAAAQALGISGVELYGPLPSPMERRAGKYRAQLLLQSAQRKTLHQLLARWVVDLAGLPAARRVRWSLDVDPIDLM